MRSKTLLEILHACGDGEMSPVALAEHLVRRAEATRNLDRLEFLQRPEEWDVPSKVKRPFGFVLGTFCVLEELRKCMRDDV